MKSLQEGEPLSRAAARAGISEPTARKYARSGLMPSTVRVAHTWRTRPDPYGEVWPEIQAWLEQDRGLEARTIWMALNERHPGRFSEGQLRTLQRRVHAWRAQFGPPREVFFPQVHQPGEQGQSDFTDMGELAITIAGEPFVHLELGVGDDLPERELRVVERGSAGRIVAPGRRAGRAPHGQPVGRNP